MARQDVVRFFLSCQDDYYDMLQINKELKEELNAGRITIERYKNSKQELSVIENNYKRLSYIMFLLNLPKRDSKKKKTIKQNEDIKQYLANANPEYIHLENTCALEKLKKVAKEAKASKENSNE